MSLNNNTGKYKDKSKSRRKINTRKLQYGGLSVVLTVVFIAVIVLANAGVTFLTDRFTLKADISAAGLYQISEQTETMLKNLTQPVDCYVLMSEKDVERQSAYVVATEFLKRYESLSGGMFRIHYEDTVANPAFMNQFDESDNVAAGSFIMKTDKRYRVCSLYDLYEISNQYDDYGNITTSYASGFKSDETFASMLHYVTTDQLPTVSFIMGHGETYGSKFKELFDNNNFEVTEVNLMFEDIPSGTDILVINGPDTDYTDEEIEKLDHYFVDDFGKGMVFMSYDAPKLDNLEAYFTEWGVEFANTWILDTSRAVGYPFNIIPMIQKTDLSETMNYDNNNDYVVAPNARSINVLWDQMSSRSTTVELKTTDKAYAKTMSLDNPVSTLYQEDGDQTGPLNICVQSQYWEWRNNRSYTARILFFSCPTIADDGPLGYTQFYNRQYLSAAIRDLTPDSNAVTLQPRDLTSTNMIVLQEQANILLIALVVVLPVLVIILGVVVWLRRRNK